MKTRTAKRPSKRAIRGASKAAGKKRTVKVGGALAATDSFAAGVVRETEELIRNMASAVTKGTDAGPSPSATDLLVHHIA